MLVDCDYATGCATLSNSQHDVRVAAVNPVRADLTSVNEDTVPRTPGLTAELESAVARWVAQSPISTGNAVSEQWVRDIVQRVAPELAQWRADTESVGRSVQQLSAQIAPELIKAIQAFTENPLRSPAAAVAAGAGQHDSSLGDYPRDVSGRF